MSVDSGERIDNISIRRTDDLLFNVRRIAGQLIAGVVEVEEFTEQNTSDIAESDVHNLGVVVEQKLSPDGKYRRLDETDVERTEKGRDAVDKSDPHNYGEYLIRNQDVVLARRLATDESVEEMKNGAKSLYISPTPTERDMDIDVALDFNYDGRTIVRYEGISPDGATKFMKSFSVFDVSIQAWQQVIKEKYGAEVAPTALAVMKFCSEELPLQYAPIDELLESLLTCAARYSDKDVQKKLGDQLNDFLYNQEELQEKINHYADEKYELQKELAMCLGGIATPKLISRLNAVKRFINPKGRAYLTAQTTAAGLKVDEFVAKILVSTHNININNRAGLAVGNLRTLLRLKSRVGAEQVETMAKTELQIIDSIKNGIAVGFMMMRNERLLAESGASCGGNCSVSIVDMYSPEGRAARAAGMTGTLYTKESFNITRKCACPALKQRPNIVSNGKDVLCTNCGVGNLDGQTRQFNIEESEAKQNVFSLEAKKAAKVKPMNLAMAA